MMKPYLLFRIGTGVFIFLTCITLLTSRQTLAAGSAPKLQTHHSDAAPPANSITFTIQWVGSLSYAVSAFSADFDQDGDMDVIAGAYRANNIIPAPMRLKRFIRQEPPQGFTSISMSTHDAADVAAADLDGDQDIDLISLNRYESQIYFWFQDENNDFSYQYRLFNATPQAIAPVDLDRDGDMDIVGVGNIVSWLENDGTGVFSHHTIKTPIPSGMSVFVVDFDQDTDLDIVYACYQTGGGIFWLENDGAQTFSLHELVPTTPTSRFAHPVDMDYDGDMDIVGLVDYDDKIVWWENNNLGNFTQHVISDNFSPDLNARANTYGVDLNRDGDMDILAAGNGPEKIVWFENDGGLNFTERLIDNQKAWMVAKPVDMDRDGDMDILAVEESAIYWFKREGSTAYIFLPLILKP